MIGLTTDTTNIKSDGKVSGSFSCTRRNCAKLVVARRKEQSKTSYIIILQSDVV